MSAKTYLQISGTIFAIVTALHIVRLISGWKMMLGGWMVPHWASIVGVVIAGFLAYTAFTLADKTK